MVFRPLIWRIFLARAFGMTFSPMHLLRTAPLVDALSHRAVSAEERAMYLLASFVVFNAIYYSGLAASSAPLWSPASFIEAAAIILVNVLGVVKTFDASGGKSNPDYVAEFTCLYVPVSITTYLGVWGVYWLLRVGFQESLVALSESNLQFAINLSNMGADFFVLLTFMANVLALAITYIRINRLLAHVQQAKLWHGTAYIHEKNGSLGSQAADA